jgi:hypothetical protein
MDWTPESDEITLACLSKSFIQVLFIRILIRCHLGFFYNMMSYIILEKIEEMSFMRVKLADTVINSRWVIELNVYETIHREWLFCFIQIYCILFDVTFLQTTLWNSLLSYISFYIENGFAKHNMIYYMAHVWKCYPHNASLPPSQNKCCYGIRLSQLYQVWLDLYKILTTLISLNKFIMKADPTI